MDDDLVNDLEEQIKILNEEYSSVVSELSEVRDELKDKEEKCSNLETKHHDCVRSYVSKMSSMAIDKAEILSEQYYEKEGYSFIDNFMTTIDQCCPDEFSESMSVPYTLWNSDEYDYFETFELFTEYVSLIDNIFSHVSVHYKTKEFENSFHETFIDPILENMTDPDMMIATIMLLYKYPEYILSKIYTLKPVFKKHILRLIVRVFFVDKPRTIISEQVRKADHINANFYLNIMRLIMMLFVEQEIKSHFHKDCIELIKKAIINFSSKNRAFFNSIITFYISDDQNVKFISDDVWNTIISNDKVVSNILQFININPYIQSDPNIKTVFLSKIPPEARKAINLYKLKGEY